MSEFDVQNDPSSTDVEELVDRLSAYNMATTGYRDVTKLGIFIRNERGELEAGVYAIAWGRIVDIDLLWVSEGRRREGLGTKLMDAIEAEAAKLPVDKIALTTYSFQARPFYEARGYRVIATVEDSPVGHSHYKLEKPVSP